MPTAQSIQLLVPKTWAGQPRTHIQKVAVECVKRAPLLKVLLIGLLVAACSWIRLSPIIPSV